MTDKCNICKRELDNPKDPGSADCGGDCLQCMADCHDPDAIRALRKARRNIRESDVERRLVKRVEECGGTSEKFVSPQRRFVPDQLVSWPENFDGPPRWSEPLDCEPIPASVAFVECKAPGKKPNKGQLRDHQRRRAMGFRVYVVDSFESVEQFLKSEGF